MATDGPLTVAVQGELGSNSELAAREYFDGRAVDIVPCRTFADLFDAVHDGRAEAAMAPLENSMAGSIHDVWELLVERPLPVHGEIRLRISHCLIVHPGAQLQQIRRICSHPQALAQCQTFLDSLDGVSVAAVYDTAGAVQMLKEAGHLDGAAIAPAQAAEDHGMQVLIRDLQSGADNFTRFLALGPDAEACADAGGTRKTTIVADMAHTAAALPAVLGRLCAAGLEVLKVETRKRVGRPWVYAVYLEFVGDLADAQTAGLVDEVSQLVSDLHIVGSYPTGIIAEPRLHPR